MDTEFSEGDAREEAAASILMSWVGFCILGLIAVAMGLSYLV